MLSNLFENQLHLGIAQALIAFVFALLVIFFTYRQSLKLEKDILISLIRGLIQIVLIGSVLVFILQGPFWVGAIVLMVMIFAAARIASTRSKEIPNALKISLIAQACSALPVILLMTWLGVIEWKLTSLIPVGSMIIAAGMNSTALVLDRVKSEIVAYRGQVEAGLALGAEPKIVIKPYIRSAYKASLIPTLNSLRSLGIVWIPGLMAGMLLAGADPVYASLYQFVVMAMIFVTAGSASLVCMMVVHHFIFSNAHQLILRTNSNGK